MMTITDLLTLLNILVVAGIAIVCGLAHSLKDLLLTMNSRVSALETFTAIIKDRLNIV